MINPPRLLHLASAAFIALLPSTISAQEYPAKTIRFITSGVGSGADLLVRLMGAGISGPMGQQVVVENRGGLIGIETVVKAPPDGYTLLLQGNVIWLLPLMQNVSYDVARDLSPITLAGSTPNLIVVHPSLPAKTVKELIAIAKSKPGALNYSAAAPGNLSHLAGELLNAMGGINTVLVFYKSAGDALNALVRQEVHLSFPVAGAVTPYLKSGRLRALAVTSAKPSILAPDLPTAAAAGLPGYEAETLYGTFVPAGTPSAIVDRLNRELVKFLNAADAKEKMLNAGIEISGTTREQAAAKIKTDLALWGKVIKDAGIRITE